MTRKQLYWWLKLTLSILLITWLILHVGTGELIDIVPTAIPAWLVAGAIVLAAGFFLNGLSLWVLYHDEVQAFDFFRAFFQATFIALWLPGRVGDLSIALLLKQKVPAEHSVIYVVADKFITLAVIGLFAGIGSFWLLNPTIGITILGGGMLAFIMLAVLLRQKNLYRRAIRWLPAPISLSIRRGRRAWTNLGRTRRSALGANLIITLVRLAVVSLTVIIFLRAFGGDVGFFTALSALAIVQFLSLVPISVQGIGVVESAYVILISQTGTASEAAILAFCLVGRVINIAVVAALHMSMVLLDREGKDL